MTRKKGTREANSRNYPWHHSEPRQQEIATGSHGSTTVQPRAVPQSVWENLSEQRGHDPGVPEETVDGMSLEKVQRLIEALRTERLQWMPARRQYIEKKHSVKKRPLGLPVWTDKVPQEVIRLMLEAYYEPQFSDLAHGFRPERGCPTALRKVYRPGQGTTWFIEGDISA